MQYSGSLRSYRKATQLIDQMASSFGKLKINPRMSEIRLLRKGRTTKSIALCRSRSIGGRGVGSVGSRSVAGRRCDTRFCTGVLDLKPIAPFHQALVIIYQNLRLWYNSPLYTEQEFELEHGQLCHADTTYSRIGLVGPKAIAEPFTGHCGTSDQKSMDSETRDGERRVQCAETVDVVNHAQKDRRREGGVGRQALQVVKDGNPRGRSRMEAGQKTLVQWNLVIEPDQFHEHAGDQHYQVAGIGILVLRRQDLGL